jgi:hypothetical protein
MPSDRPRNAKGGFPVWAIVLLCAVPVVAIVAITGAFAMFAMTRHAKIERAEAQANLTMARAEANRTYACDEFKALMMGTPADVTAAVGPPEFRIVAGGRTTWHYLNKSEDPATGKIDPVTKVVFESGVVVGVNYQP